MAAPERTTYGLTKFQLMDLMAQRQAEGLAAIDEQGGTDSIADHLHTNIKTGIHSNQLELEDRRLAFGANFIPPVPPKAFLALAFEALQDKTLIILMVAAVVSIILGVTVEEQKEIAWIDGAAIFAAVLLVVFVTAINDWTKERQFRGLKKKLDTDSHFSVRRDGVLIELPLADLVVGDIGEFKYGNSFPVDGILMLGYDVKVDESSLTGEAELAKKGLKRDRMLYAGTQVMEGSGSMLVTGVGPYSQQGQIFQLLSQRSGEEAGFITLALRKLKRKCLGCCKKPVEGESEEGPGEKGSPEVEEKPCDTKENPKAVSSDEGESADEAEEDEPLTGMSKLNLVKVMKRRKMRKRRKREQQNDTPEVSSGSLLQKKLNKLAIQIGYGGTIAATVCILVLVLKFVIIEFGINGRAWDSSMDISQLLHFVIIGVTVLVVAVPEGLPLAVTIALAFSVKKMLKDRKEHTP